MAREPIPLPRFGEGVNTAELIAWLVDAGSEIKRGDDYVWKMPQRRNG